MRCTAETCKTGVCVPQIGPLDLPKATYLAVPGLREVMSTPRLSC